MKYKNLLMSCILIIQNINTAIIKDATLPADTAKYIQFLNEHYKTHKPRIALPNKMSTIAPSLTKNQLLINTPYKTGKSLTSAIAHARASLDAIAKLSTEIIANQSFSIPQNPTTNTTLLHKKFLKLLSDCYEPLFHPFMLADRIDSFYPEYKLQLLSIAIDQKNKKESLQQITEILHRLDNAWHLYANLLYNGAEHIEVKLNWSDYEMSIDEWRGLTMNNALDIHNLPIIRKLTAMELWLLRSWHKAQRYALSWVL